MQTVIRLGAGKEVRKAMETVMDNETTFVSDMRNGFSTISSLSFCLNSVVKL
jgi:hypothetical protein